MASVGSECHVILEFPEMKLNYLSLSPRSIALIIRQSDGLNQMTNDHQFKTLLCQVSFWTDENESVLDSILFSCETN
jgi:hypothetical protein